MIAATAGYYRDKAQELRRLAAAMRFYEPKQQLLQLAEGFDALATRLERMEAAGDEQARPDSS